jgi:hypothetical protein
MISATIGQLNWGDCDGCIKDEDKTCPFEKGNGVDYIEIDYDFITCRAFEPKEKK